MEVSCQVENLYLTFRSNSHDNSCFCGSSVIRCSSHRRTVYKLCFSLFETLNLKICFKWKQQIFLRSLSNMVCVLFKQNRQDEFIRTVCRTQSPCVHDFSSLSGTCVFVWFLTRASAGTIHRALRFSSLRFTWQVLLKTQTLILIKHTSMQCL